jgi:hypothetical protein
VNQRLHTSGLKDIVYVLNVNAQPLMPCSCAKARKLLKKRRANVVKNYPFTIRLTFNCENVVQDVMLGIDSGFKYIGYSAITKTKELISGTLTLDCQTISRLANRRMYRRNRRDRLWYRKSRFNNRKSSKKGWLSPSIKRKYNTHVNLINKLKKLLPIKEVIIEVAKFNSNIKSSKLIDNSKCQLCHKNFSNTNHVNEHHIITRLYGTNRKANIAYVHESCHKKIHKNKMLDMFEKDKIYRQSAFMNIISKRFLEDGYKTIFGFDTFNKRQVYNLEKTHTDDAFIIAGGDNQERAINKNVVQKHRNNRILQLNRKGFKRSIRRQRFKIQPKDLIWINNKKYISKGCFGKRKRVTYNDENGKSCQQYIDRIDKYYNFGSLIFL